MIIYTNIIKNNFTALKSVREKKCEKASPY